MTVVAEDEPGVLQLLVSNTVGSAVLVISVFAVSFLSGALHFHYAKTRQKAESLLAEPAPVHGLEEEEEGTSFGTITGLVQHSLLSSYGRLQLKGRLALLVGLLGGLLLLTTAFMVYLRLSKTVLDRHEAELAHDEEVLEEERQRNRQWADEELQRKIAEEDRVVRLAKRHRYMLILALLAILAGALWSSALIIFGEELGNALPAAAVFLALWPALAIAMGQYHYSLALVLGYAVGGLILPTGILLYYVWRRETHVVEQRHYGFLVGELIAMCLLVALLALHPLIFPIIA